MGEKKKAEKRAKREAKAAEQAAREAAGDLSATDRDAAPAVDSRPDEAIDPEPVVAEPAPTPTGAPPAPKPRKLPGTRAELLALHRQTRARRNAATHGSQEHVEAVELIGRIEIEIARIERAMDPPLV
jgi:hypothetical protein